MVISVISWLALAGVSLSQTLSSIQTISPLDVALMANNISVNEEAGFQVYHQDFLQILGTNPTTTLVVNETLPYFHEAGVITSNNPLTIFTTSNQYDTDTPSPDTNNKTIVVSRTTQDNNTGEWIHEVVNNNTAPLLLANGGFPYQDGILFAAQGTLSSPAALVYLPTPPTTSNLSLSYPLLNNYLGKPLNSPNDIHITRNGVIYFTDPTIGYQQDIRPTPSLPNQVYAFVPNTTDIRPVADHFGNPNGITFSPDEKTVYITDSVSQDPATNLSSYRTIYAYDVVYSAATPQEGEIGYFANRRVFAMPGEGIPDGIKCDTEGNVYVGCEDGINVYSSRGVLLGKILVQGGTSNFGFASDGRLLAMNEERLWLVQLSQSVQPAVAAGG